MIYKDFQDIKLPMLSVGAMRLPVTGEGTDAVIDQSKTEEMVDYAMEHGINYFDTAWGYHDGQSEVAMGKALARYPRDSYFVADKFPGYDLNNMDKVEEIFEEQLKRTGLEYFDFYLFHNVCELNVKQYLDDETYGIMTYLRKQKEAGRIRHLGFSTHGRIDTITEFLNAYGDEMEFCQIQLNYLDWKLQKTDEVVALLNEKNIPIFVMEPLRGGKLAALSEENTAKLRSLRPEESTAAWAFRFLQSISGVKLILSGMSNLQQLQENTAVLSEEKPVSEEEFAALMEVADSMLEILPCTACRYCTSHCPQGLDIPTLMFMYNEVRYQNGFITQMGIGAMEDGKKPHDCIACGACEAVCPQQIRISEVMADFVERMKAPVQL